MTYQYVREPLTGDEADRLANACEIPEEKLVVWTLLDTGLRVSELCALRHGEHLLAKSGAAREGQGRPPWKALETARSSNEYARARPS